MVTALAAVGLIAAFAITAIAFASGPPTVGGESAGSGDSTPQEILYGTVNPNGSATTYQFEWGTTVAYGNTTTVTSAGSGSAGVSEQAEIGPLTAGATYHYRLDATNSSGTTNGTDQTFTADNATGPPIIRSQGETSVGSSSTSHVVNGAINPHGFATTYQFEYGTTTAYGNATTATASGSGSSVVNVTVTLTGLTPSTTYHYRLDATNSAGTNNFVDTHFTTPLSTVSVALAGTGSGGVNASDFGMSCSGTSAGSSCSESFTAPLSVTLTASPNSGSHFAGWLGSGCSGTGTCQLTMSTDHMVTATFDLGSLVSPPVAGKNVDVAPVSGTVLIKAPGATTFTQLQAGQQIPLGSTVDSTNGVVTLTTAKDAKQHTATGQFYAGIFRVTQQRQRASELTLLTLAGAKPTGCTATHAEAAKAKPKPRHQTVRSLWGTAKGSFGTVGSYASATERGTKWLTQDTCGGTLVRVTQGSVSVNDFPHHRAFVLSAPHSFLAHPGKGG